MKLAIYQRQTSSTEHHKVAIRLGEGDHREININEAQDLYESLGMKLAADPSLLSISIGEGDTRILPLKMAKHLLISLEVAIQDYLDFVNGEFKS